MQQSDETLSQNEFNEWKESIIGRTWEVYWEPQTTTSSEKMFSSLSSTSSSEGTPIIETDDDENSLYDADWYDGFIRSYSKDKGMFEVLFVGEDTIYEMNLKPENVRPLEKGVDHTQEGQFPYNLITKKPNRAVGECSLRWKEHLVGKEWEIYWDMCETAIDVEDQRPSDFDADWYEGRVQSYSSQSDIFQVSFTGEDCVYHMHLGPEVIRPSANAWIRRSKVLLSLDDVEGLCQLPAASATLDEWNSIKDQILTRMEKASSSYNNDRDERNDLVLKLREKLQEQIILRDHLQVDSHDIFDDGASPNTRTEQYINYLLRCLELNIKACDWYWNTNCMLAQHVYKIDESIDHQIIHDEPDLQRESLSVPLEVNTVHNEILHGFHLYLRVLTMKIEVDAVNVKKRQTSFIQNNQNAMRSRKRRRRDTSTKLQRFDTSEEPVRDLLDEIIETDLPFDIPSNRLVWHTFVQCLNVNTEDNNAHNCPCVHIFSILKEKLSVYNNDSKLLVDKMSDSIHSVLSLIWDKVLKFLLSSNRILLCKDLPFENESSKQGDIECETLYSKECIESSIQMATTDPLLRRFNLSLYKSNLREKIYEIQVFESKAWSHIATCTNNDVKLPSTISEQLKESDMEHYDNTILKLREIRDEMETNPHLKNISPIGKLTRKNVDDAIMLRLWVIHYCRIQGCRERVSLMHRLRSYNTGELSFPHDYKQRISPILLKMRQTLEERWKESNELNNLQIPFTMKEYDCEKKCNITLQSLSRSTMITSSEEKLTIISDVLALKSAIVKILDASKEHKVDLHIVKDAFRILSDLRRGKSTMRNRLTAGLLQNIECEKKMTAFSLEAIKWHLGALEQKFVDIHDIGHSWEQSVKAILQVSMLDSRNEGKSFNVGAKVQMVDFTKIEDLITQYKEGIISFPIYFDQLKGIYDNVSSWVQRFTKIVSFSRDFCPLRCSSHLVKLRSIRPKRILMYPPRHLVDLWIELLQWYESSVQACCDLERFCGERNPNLPLQSTSGPEIDLLISHGRDLIREPSISPLQKFFDNLSFEEEDEKKNPSGIFMLEKLNSQPQGKKLVEAIKRHDKSLGNKGIIVTFRLLMWERSVLEILMKSNSPQQVTLQDARVLLDYFESSELDVNFEGNILLKYIYDETYCSLKNRIVRFEQIENNAKYLLNTVQNLNLEELKLDYLIDLTTRMKTSRNEIKTSYVGFRVDKSIECHISQRIRDSLWLASILKFEALTRDIKCKKSSEYCAEILSTSSRKVSFQDFIALCDKVPQVKKSSTKSNFENMLKEIGVNLKKIKADCDEWDGKVQSKLPLSTRGLKRRRKVVPETKGRSHDKNSHLVTVKEMQELLSHPVLDIVEMPLQTVVKQVLNNAVIVENELKLLLTSDIESDDIDRTPIPTSPSLIGTNGELSLFKLVGGNIFAEMQKRLRTIDALCAELDDIKTNEVITIQWISNAIRWIESLSSLMLFGSNSQLQLSMENAEYLAVSGASIFLGVDDIVKRCILRHKISLYTNKNTRNFSVKVARGGNPHSVGAYVLRWIEFCFNGLRGDIYLTREFAGRVDHFSPKHDSYEVVKSLSEVRANLLVSPGKETSAYFAELLNEHSLQDEGGGSSKQGDEDNNNPPALKFHHNLLFHNEKKSKKRRLRRRPIRYS